MGRLRASLCTILLALLARPALAQRRPEVAARTGLDFANVASDCPAPILLPEPTGHHQVGTVTYHWVDDAREDRLSADPDDDRQVIVTIFYPGLRDRDSPGAPYIPELEMLREGFRSDRRDVPKKIARDLARHGCVLTSAFRGIRVDGTGRYPVVLFSPGGNMSRHWHTAMAQELASHGYVVAVMSHEHSGLDVFPRGGFLMSSPHWQLPDSASEEEWGRLEDELADLLAGDASFTLDRLTALDEADPAGRFTGRLDLDRVAIIGHSRGGTTVGRACATDARFDACVVYDNIGPDREVATGLSRPQLVVRRPWPDARVATLRGYLEKNRVAAYDVVLAGAVHMSFSDLPFVEPDRHPADIDAAVAHRAIADVTLAFLHDHLLDRSPPALAKAVAAHPETTMRRYGASARGR